MNTTELKHLHNLINRGENRAALKVLGQAIDKQTIEENKIEFTKISSDTFGNPRYVCHFLAFQKDDENISYEQAIKRANKLGGRKYHTKSYGGGIVFQSYNIKDTERQIKEFLANLG